MFCPEKKEKFKAYLSAFEAVIFFCKRREKNQSNKQVSNAWMHAAGYIS